VGAFPAASGGHQQSTETVHFSHSCYIYMWVLSLAANYCALSLRQHGFLNVVLILCYFNIV